MLQAVAVIFKRGTLDNDATDRDGLFNDVTQLISSGDISMVRKVQRFEDKWSTSVRSIVT